MKIIAKIAKIIVNYSLFLLIVQKMCYLLNGLASNIAACGSSGVHCYDHSLIELEP